MTDNTKEVEISDELEIEVVDDRPPEDQHRPADVKPADELDPEGEATDDEIAAYGSRADKRIKKLRFEWHEQRRAKEAAEREAAEVTSFADKLTKENQRLLKQLQESQNAVRAQAAKRAELAVKNAQRDFEAAYADGDPAKIAEAQKNLTDAQVALRVVPNLQVTSDIPRKERNVELDVEPDAEPNDKARVPVPDKKALEWRDRNTWFGQDEEMTSLAYGIHEKLVKEGVDTNSDEYYQRIDKRMRQVFPDRFEDGSTSKKNGEKEVAITTSPPKPVVAPATRTSGATPRRITLTATQVRVAKRLGLTPEQYARQLLKEQNNVQ